MDGCDLNSESKYLISIVVPCYNCQDTLDSTVNSLIKQQILEDVIEVQIILVDDGSTDRTPTICDNYSSKYQNIFVIHKENGGLVDAWKTGVRSAQGQYIAFCDSDDYIDKDFVKTISQTIIQFKPELIVFGMTFEYDNGDIIHDDVLLTSGYYDRTQIANELFPVLLSNGDMQTELLQSSRCNKVFAKCLLDKILDDIPENVSFGEDDITCFAAELNTNSIYCIRGYYPYHYVRNTSSMIGTYDVDAFIKIEKLYKALKKISEKYRFNYPEQVDKDILSILFVYLKKEICKNPNGLKSVLKRLNCVHDSEAFVCCYDKETIRNYGISKRLFALLFYKKWFVCIYIISRIYEGIRRRNV